MANKNNNTTFIPFMNIGAPTAEDNAKEMAKAAEALYGIYQSFIKAGFSEGQAMTLVLATLTATLKQ